MHCEKVRNITECTYISSRTRKAYVVKVLRFDCREERLKPLERAVFSRTGGHSSSAQLLVCVYPQSRQIQKKLEGGTSVSIRSRTRLARRCHLLNLVEPGLVRMRVVETVPVILESELVFTRLKKGGKPARWT